MEGQFLPPDSINSLAPAVAEVPDHCGWFECKNLYTLHQGILDGTFQSTNGEIQQTHARGIGMKRHILKQPP